jgi:hypothetical protein
MSDVRFMTRASRAAVYLLLLALPVVTAWNLIAAPVNGRLFAIVGQRLGGVTPRAPVVWSWAALKDGTLQKALATRVDDANPLRPVLIRIHNQIRATLFDELTAPNLLRGHDRQLIERFYVEEYCGRKVGMADQRAAKSLPLIRDIQTYYQSRGGVFLYVITPSKAVHMPEAFVELMPCPSTRQARDELRPRFAQLLQDSGIEVLDTAALLHAQKQDHPVALFPRSGVHWNDLGLAIATLAVIEKLNAVAGRAVAPPFTYTYSVDNLATGRDNDLFNVQNQLVQPPSLPTPHARLSATADCRQHPARDLDAAVVGSSFIQLSAELMASEACLSQLSFYFYLVLSRETGVPFRVVDKDLDAPRLARLREARVMILEENEAALGKSGYVEALHDVLFKQ